MINDNNESTERKVGETRRSEAVYSFLYDGIVSGRLGPGERIGQEKLSIDFGVSQVTVREALNHLVAVGLAERLPRRGVRVCDIPAEDIRDTYTLRLQIEPIAWRAAVPRISDRDLAEMRLLLPGSAVGEDPGTVLSAREANREFHMIPIKASGRRYLIRILSDIFQLNNAYYRLAAGSREARQEDGIRNLEEHDGLITALEKRDERLVERLIKKHIEQAMRNRLALQE